jgi:hypothetical protein
VFEIPEIMSDNIRHCLPRGLVVEAQSMSQGQHSKRAAKLKSTEEGVCGTLSHSQLLNKSNIATKVPVPVFSQEYLSADIRWHDGLNRFLYNSTNAQLPQLPQ